MGFGGFYVVLNFPVPWLPHSERDRGDHRSLFTSLSSFPSFWLLVVGESGVHWRGRDELTPPHATSLWIEKKLGKEAAVYFVVLSSHYIVSFHLHRKPMAVGFINPIL